MTKFVLISEEGKNLVSNFLELFLKFGILTLFLVINFSAVSIALLCNQDKGIGLKIIIALFAFMFGILYILINYYSYKIVMLKSPCKYNGKVFPL